MNFIIYYQLLNQYHQYQVTAHHHYTLFLEMYRYYPLISSHLLNLKNHYPINSHHLKKIILFTNELSLQSNNSYTLIMIIFMLPAAIDSSPSSDSSLSSPSTDSSLSSLSTDSSLSSPSSDSSLSASSLRDSRSL